MAAWSTTSRPWKRPASSSRTPASRARAAAARPLASNGSLSYKKKSLALSEAFSCRLSLLLRRIHSRSGWRAAARSATGRASAEAARSACRTAESTPGDRARAGQTLLSAAQHACSLHLVFDRVVDELPLVVMLLLLVLPERSVGTRNHHSDNRAAAQRGA